MPDIKLDAVDLKILELLQVNGRITNQELAQSVGLTPTPTLERVKRLERDGVLAGYKAIVNKTAVGRGLTVFCSIKLSVHQLQRMDEFHAHVESVNEIVSCWNVTGEYDYLMQVVVHDIAEYDRFMRSELSRIPGIERIYTSIVLSTVKEHSPIPLTYENDRI